MYVYIYIYIYSEETHVPAYIEFPLPRLETRENMVDQARRTALIHIAVMDDVLLQTYFFLFAHLQGHPG